MLPAIGLGSQQRLHARLVPLASGHHQGGAALVGLQVGVGLGSQQRLHARLVPTASCKHQGGVAEVVLLQVKFSRVLQQD